MAEPQPGLGRGGGRGSNVTAGFKIDASSLREVTKLWADMARHVKEFNAQIKAIDSKKLQAMAAAMGGMRAGMGGGPTIAGVGGGTLTPTSWTNPPGSGPSWTRSNAGLIYPTPAQPGQPGAPPPPGTPKGGNGGHQPLTPGQWARRGAVGVIAGIAAYGGSHRQNMVDAERLAQINAWATPATGNNPRQHMDLIRHQWFGGNGQQGLSGFTSTGDLLEGMSYLQSRQGLGMNNRDLALQRDVSRMANVQGDWRTGSKTAADLYSVSNFYGLQSIGIQTIGQGGQKKSTGAIAREFLMAVYGRMPTGTEIGQGIQEGAPLRANMEAFGLSPEVQDWIIRYGLQSSKIQEKTGKLPTAKEMDKHMSKLGGAKDALGKTTYDKQREQAQASSRLEQELADNALPAMRAAIEAVTTALGAMHWALKDNAIGAAVGGGAGVGAVMSPAVSAMMGFGGGMLPMLLAGMMGRGALGRAFGGGRGGRGGGGGGGGGGRGTPPVIIPPGGGPGKLARVKKFLRGPGGKILTGAGLVIGADWAGDKIGHRIAEGHRGDKQGAAGRAVHWGATGAATGALATSWLGPGAGIGAAVGGTVGAGAGFLTGILGDNYDPDDYEEGLGGAQDSPGGYGSQEEVDLVASSLASGVSIPGQRGGPSANGPGGQTTAVGEDPSSPSNVSGRAARALAWAAAQSRNATQNWKNYCLRFVRMAFGVGGRDGDANEGWANAKMRHGGTPPPGVPVWWTGGKYGHVALSAGGGMVWSNDILRSGGIDKVPIDTITRRWGKQYRGWSEDINGVDIYDAEGGTNAGGVKASGNSVAAAKAYARSRLRAYGWGNDQWDDLEALWQGESDWNYRAANPTSSARGIPQAMMSAHFGRNWASSKAAQRYLGSASTQIDWGLRYIAGRYGSPSAALDFWNSKSPHWYGEGAILNGPQVIGVGERGSEAVIPLDKRGVRVLSEAMTQYADKRQSRSIERAAGGGGGLHITLQMPIHMAHGNTSVDAKNLVDAVVRELEHNERLLAVIGGD